MSTALFRIAFPVDTKSFLAIRYNMRNNGSALKKVVYTHRTSCRSNWCTKLLSNGLVYYAYHWTTEDLLARNEIT